VVKKFNRKVRKGLRKERKVQEYGFMVKILTEQTLTIKLFRLKEKPFQRQVL
jgi:predicted N-acyltransferase